MRYRQRLAQAPQDHIKRVLPSRMAGNSQARIVTVILMVADVSTAGPGGWQIKDYTIKKNI
ncbi:MAG: hypothetical protein VR64_03395 [Desulfatitalea sp. BRH_c12]|nr:MAG: hypothetical protein VR64_03395 [Desulfatitalea sp. BRH_c12]